LRYIVNKRTELTMNNATQISQSRNDKKQVTVALSEETIEMYLELKSRFKKQGDKYSLTVEIEKMVRKAHTENIGLFAFSNVDSDARLCGVSA
jgi:hypothetical protein